MALANDSNTVMGQKKDTLRIRYQGLHRFLDGITLICTVVCVIASALSGATIATIVLRGTVAGFGLLMISRVLIKTWVTWENIKRGESG